MTPKLSLSLEDEEGLIATVYGIISDLPDYRLAFMINQELGLRLTRCASDKKLYHKAGIVQYSEFSYHEEFRMINWYLTSNTRGIMKSEDSDNAELSSLTLVSSLKSINYFLWFDDDKNPELHKHIFEALKPNPYIRVIQEVSVPGTRNIENLIAE